MKFAAKRRPDPLVDITPMIDIVFQLVLFFMVSTTFISAPGIQVDLPRSSAQTVLTEKREINVWMTPQGAVYVDDEPMTGEELRTRFRQAAERDTGTLVIIKADTAVEHGRVVTVMDLARSEGLARLAIATETDPAK